MKNKRDREKKLQGFFFVLNCLPKQTTELNWFLRSVQSLTYVSKEPQAFTYHEQRTF